MLKFRLFFQKMKVFFRPVILPSASALPAQLWRNRHLLTNELIEQMKVKLPLLENGFTAVTFYREELEAACGIQGTHAVLAPLIQRFLEELLFVEKVTLFDPRLCSRLADADVREHIRAVFIPLILSKVTTTEQRLKGAAPVSVCSWRPFQVTHSARHPVETATKTPFNLVPCNRDLEVALTHFTDHAGDVAAFCKNAGPQCLRIDYLAAGGRLAFYTPDFLIRNADGSYMLVETKGREDRDVPAKARAAVAWCKSASTKAVKWEYLYVPQGVFDRFNGKTLGDLARTCAPALATLLQEKETAPMLPFEQAEAAAPPAGMEEFIRTESLAALPKNTAGMVNQAIQLFRFYENKTDLTFSPVFTPLLGPIDKCAQDLVFDRLVDDIPKMEPEQRGYFAPYMKVAEGRARFLTDNARRIQKLLVYNAAIMPTGVLRFCLEYSESPVDGIGGLFASIRRNFQDLRGNGLSKLVADVYEFRNTYIAHQDKELKDVKATREALKAWIGLIVWLESLFEAGSAAT